MTEPRVPRGTRRAKAVAWRHAPSAIRGRTWALLRALMLSALLVQAWVGMAPQARAQSGSGVQTTPSAQALDALLAQARESLAAGRAGEAYAALEAQATRYAGAPAFDYLLGLAALDAGRPGAAVIALERVLAADPSNLPARAEIGRAHLALRELEAARRELRTVERAELPPAVRDTVRRYLDTVARLDVRRPAWIVLLETGLGWDSNVNFGSSSGEWLLADGQALVPLPSSRPRESAFASVAAGLTRVAPINGWLDWTAGLQIAQRVNPSQHNIDTGTADLSAGLSAAMRAHRFSMSAQFQHLRLDGDALRNAAGAIGQWQWDSGPRTQAGAYLQGFDLSFPGQPVRDARRVAAGLTLAHGFGGALSPTLAAALYRGDETAREDVPQLSFGFAGVRSAIGASIAPGWRANAGWSFERRGFDAPEALFGTTRVDRQHDLRAGLEHDLTRSLTIAPGVSWTRNASTIAPNDFRRTQAFVHARYRF